MDADRSRYGLLVSTLGATVLAVAVFVPWYGVTRVSAALPGVRAVAPAATLSAVDTIEGMSIALLVLASLAMLDAVLPLVRHARVPAGAGASLGLIGSLAAACVVFRMIDLPAPAGAPTLSVRIGAWLALAGSLAIVAGGFWPRVAMPPALAAHQSFEGGWSGLSGWTPQR